jgi:drug/metabolite transporter (DMT)-like permease
MTTLLLAALSAVLYGAGVAVEHRQAARTPTGAPGRPWLLALLARQPLWLIGAALEAGGFAMHAAALSSGSLLAVQMILGCSLLVSVSLSSVLARRPLPRRCWPAIFAIVASVGVSVALLGPDGHSGDHSSGQAASAALVTGLITVPIAAVGLLATGRRARPLLLAVAAGMADTCVAVLTMAFAHTFGHGLSAVAASWPLYALIVGGLGSLALTQAAYQTDAPLITLPIISALTPLASLAVGILVLHEATHLSSTRSVVGIICLMLAVTALVILARAAAALADDGSLSHRRPADDLCDQYVEHSVPPAVRPVPRNAGPRNAGLLSSR